MKEEAKKAEEERLAEKARIEAEKVTFSDFKKYGVLDDNFMTEESKAASEALNEKLELVKEAKEFAKEQDAAGEEMSIVDALIAAEKEKKRKEAERIEIERLKAE